MRQVLSRSLLTAAATTGVLAAAAGYAQADAGAGSATSNSPGVGSGNSVQAPVGVPVNACGNSVSVIGLLNPVFGNSCANVDGTAAASKPRREASEPERPAPDRAPERPAAQPAPEKAPEKEPEKAPERAPVDVTTQERASSTQQAPPQQAAAEVRQAEPASPASATGEALAETGAAGTGTAAAVGAGVLIGGVVLYRRSTRRPSSRRA